MRTSCFRSERGTFCCASTIPACFWRGRPSGFSKDGRGLLGHEDGRFHERGLSGSFARDRASDSDRGPSPTLSRALGASATYDADALFRDGVPTVLDSNDNGGLDARRFEAKLGRLFGAFGGRFTMTPEVSLGLSNDIREYGLGRPPSPRAATAPRSSQGTKRPGTKPPMTTAVRGQGPGTGSGPSSGRRGRTRQPVRCRLYLSRCPVSVSIRLRVSFLLRAASTVPCPAARCLGTFPAGGWFRSSVRSVCSFPVKQVKTAGLTLAGNDGHGDACSPLVTGSPEESRCREAVTSSFGLVWANSGCRGASGHVANHLATE